MTDAPTEVTPEETRLLKQEIQALKVELKQLKEKEAADKSGGTSGSSRREEDQRRLQATVSRLEDEQRQVACAWKFVYEYRTKYDKLVEAIREDDLEKIRKDFPEIFG